VPKGTYLCQFCARTVKKLCPLAILVARVPGAGLRMGASLADGRRSPMNVSSLA